MSVQFTAKALSIWNCLCFQQFFFSIKLNNSVGIILWLVHVSLSVRVSTCRFTKAALTSLWQLHNKPQSPHNAGVREVVALASRATRWQGK
jgi:hypothetical protein